VRIFRIVLPGAVLILLFFNSLLVAQQFNFERKITPFFILNQTGVAYDLPFTGGMNRPVQQLVDIDGDGDPDLFVQEYQANRLIFFRNTGTPLTHQLEWETDHFENLEVGSWFKFADVDNDGDFDLFAERPVGVIRYFRNDGSPTSPNFVMAVDSLKDIAGNSIFIDGFSVPEWADIDCDTNLDLFIGNILDGSITFYRHVGLDPDGNPRFEFVTNTFQGLKIMTGGAEALPSPVPGNHSQLHGANSLTFVDIDNDQDNDLFWGDFFWNSLIYLPNSGTCQNPNFDTTLMIMNYPFGNPIYSGGFNVPRFADIDADGDFDMFVGVLGGSISFILDRAENLYFYENVGSNTQPDFTLRTKQFVNSIDIGQNTIPTLVDIDDDGDLDLFLSNQEDLAAPQHANSRLHFFENTGTATTPYFQLLNTHYLNYDKLFDLNYAPAFADIDNDNDKDLLLGKWDGKLTFYRNDGNSGSPDFVRINENYAGIYIGSYSTPTFVDIDDDGDFDLFIGEFTQPRDTTGRINFYRNNGSNSSPIFELVTKTYFGIDPGVGEFLYPFFADIDRDLDYDLFIGSETKGILMYRNDGTPQSANFVPDASFQLPLQLHTSPNLADIDNDGDLDIFSGSKGGGIIFYENLEISVGIDPVSAVNANLPETIGLLRNYPNPFNPQTTIEYELNLTVNQLGNTHSLTIYNNLGQKIRNWEIPNRQLIIRQLISWNGRDETGLPVPSGIYFYQVKVDANASATGKMLLAR
jgi:hypothetical protein